MAKYRQVFLEEAAEHLAEMSRELLALEKDPALAESIDVMFRMAHSIKGMAASLSYDVITTAAHRLEDQMQQVRGRGRVEPTELGQFFEQLDALESMVNTVRDTGEPPPEAPKKKVPTP